MNFEFPNLSLFCEGDLRRGLTRLLTSAFGAGET